MTNSESLSPAKRVVAVAQSRAAHKERMRAEVLAGLTRAEKTLPSKYFYDAEGSQLFEQICEQPEYYPTRTELEIMAESGDAIVAALGTGIRLVEFGSGSSLKTRELLDHLVEPTSYVPVEISGDMLGIATAALRARYPELLVEPLRADYTQPFALPPAPEGTRRTVCYFPGSTIGNFEVEAAVEFLRNAARICGKGGGLLIGVDLRKSTRILLPAYNDAAGVTARFNKNVLRHVSSALGADFDPALFEHRAIWNGQASRIEMQLVSLRDHVVTVAGCRIPFGRGEVVTTEYSHKYTLEAFAELARRGGFDVDRVWSDPNRWFSVQLLRST